jgi:hypothetical protein
MKNEKRLSVGFSKIKNGAEMMENERRSSKLSGKAAKQVTIYLTAKNLEPKSFQKSSKLF